MTVVDVSETGPGTPHRLTRTQARELSASKAVNVEQIHDHSWLVSGNGKVGVVRVADMTVRVQPKLPIGRIFFLLGYGRKFTWHDDVVSYDTTDDVVHVLADAFVRQAERALGRGVLQGYVEHDDELAVVRGRLRATEQLTRRFGQVTPLMVRYDDFTIDIAENQLVLAAARAMRTVPGIEASVARRLRAISIRLDDVSSLTSGEELPEWSINRRNAHYETVLWLAAMILRHRSLDLPAGTVDVNGFMINMATVFEDFLETALGNALERVDGRVHAQDPQWFDIDSNVKMNPDLVWYRGGQPVAVIDAKYKSEKVAGYPNADLYQMLAYCTALGLPVGHLVYAKGNDSETDHTVRGSGVEIRAHALDLELLPGDLLAQVDALAMSIASGSAGRVR